MNDRAVVIFSGGLDSTTLLHQVAKTHVVYGLTFDYRQRHRKELRFAEYWANRLCQEWKCVDIGFLSEFGQSALTSDLALPNDHYTHENQRITVVPNRNMIMLSIAVGYAEGKNIDQVYYACHANDRAIYPDCRQEFVDALDQASQLGTYSQVRILAPFVQKSKADVVAIGTQLGVNFVKTWSCYAGNATHCGQCATCQERIEAFQLAGIEDPTIYQL